MKRKYKKIEVGGKIFVGTHGVRSEILNIFKLYKSKILTQRILINKKLHTERYIIIV